MTIGEVGRFNNPNRYILDAITLAQIQAIHEQQVFSKELAKEQRSRLFPFKEQLLAMVSCGYSHKVLLMWLASFHGIEVHRTTLGRAIVKWQKQDKAMDDRRFSQERV